MASSDIPPTDITESGGSFWRRRKGVELTIEEANDRAFAATAAAERAQQLRLAAERAAQEQSAERIASEQSAAAAILARQEAEARATTLAERAEQAYAAREAAERSLVDLAREREQGEIEMRACIGRPACLVERCQSVAHFFDHERERRALRRR